MYEMTNLVEFIDGEDEPIFQSKRCKECKEVLPFTSFKPRNATKKKVELLNTCIDCKDKHDRVVRLYKKYNPKPDSDYKCPCCKLTSQQIKDKHGGFHSHQSKDVWCVDVCHITITARGYICDYCNNAIGRAADSIYVLISCAIYVLKFKLKRLFNV